MNIKKWPYWAWGIIIASLAGISNMDIINFIVNASSNPTYDIVYHIKYELLNFSKIFVMVAILPFLVYLVDKSNWNYVKKGAIAFGAYGLILALINIFKHIANSAGASIFDFSTIFWIMSYTLSGILVGASLGFFYNNLKGIK